MQYFKGELLEKDLKDNPFEQFNSWYQDAFVSDSDLACAMNLATVGGNGRPAARVVLLKEVTPRGFVFYTNYASRKGDDIQQNPHVALTFFWKEQERQVRIEGSIYRVSDEEADAYFATRPFESQVGAWASSQSTELSSRKALDDRFDELYQLFKDQEVPRPDYWGGFVVVPFSIEFWQGRPNRMNDRIVFKRKNDQDNWIVSRLAP